MVSSIAIKYQSIVCIHLNGLDYYERLNSSVWPIDRTLSGATTPRQIEPGSNGNEVVLCILQIPRAGALAWDSSIAYPGYTSVVSYLSAEIQSVYSTVPINRGDIVIEFDFQWILHTYCLVPN